MFFGLHSFWTEVCEIHSFVLLYVMCIFSFVVFKIFLLIMGFQKFEYNVSWCGFHCIYPAWHILNFLDLWVYNINQIWKILALSSNIFSVCPVSFWDSHTQMLDCLIFSQKLQFYFLSLPPPFGASSWIVFIPMSSGSVDIFLQCLIYY